MKKILITGGLGFIGSNFIKYIFNKYDYKIFNIDLKTYAANYKNISKKISQSERYSLYLCDINETDKIRNLINENKINYIVNFASESHVDNSIKNSTPFIHTNINGTHSLLSLLHDCPSIDRFLQVSTDEVYGTSNEKDKPFTENSPVKPNNPYSASKACADLLCRSFYKTFKYPILITRCSNNYGPNQHEEKFIPLMIKNAKAGKKLPIYGNGKNIRDWIHVTDHCSGIDVVLHNGKIGEIYNIRGKNEMRNIDVAKIILLSLGKNENQIEFVKDRPGHDWSYAIDDTKIKNELNWSQSVVFKEGLKELL